MSEPMVSTSAAERETGVSKETLRAWERRYGYPTPIRDAFGVRAYPTSQIEKLRIVKCLIDIGHRPGQRVPLPVEALQQLSENGARAVVAPAATPQLSALVELLREHELDRLRGQLRQALVRLGLSAFVTEVIAPMNRPVGDAWMRGQIEIFQEHSDTDLAQGALRAGLNSLPEAGPLQHPRVLLGTLAGEPRGLGLLMAEAIFAAEGVQCFSLGTQTPVWGLVLAAAACRADLVASSLSVCMNPNRVVDALAELRSELPAEVEPWAGGSAPVPHRRAVDGVMAMKSLDELPDALRRWRAGHG